MTLIYGVVVFVIQMPLFVGIFVVSFWLLSVAGPLLRGDVAFGHPAYEYLQNSKDLLVSVLGVLTVTMVFSSVLLRRWWKRSSEALGPMPAELRPQTVKAWNRQKRTIRATYLFVGAGLVWILVQTVNSVISGLQAYNAWSALGSSGYGDPGYAEAHYLFDLSVVQGSAAAVGLIALSVSNWRRYRRAQQLLGPEPARVVIREIAMDSRLVHEGLITREKHNHPL